MFGGCSPLCSVPPPPPDSTHSCLLLSPPTVSRCELHPAVSLLSFSFPSSFSSPSLVAIFNATHFQRDPVTPSRYCSSRHPRAPNCSLLSVCCCLSSISRHSVSARERAGRRLEGGGVASQPATKRRPAPFGASRQMPALFKSGCVGAAQLSPCPVNPLRASDEQAQTQKTKGNKSVSQAIHLCLPELLHVHFTANED